MKIPDFEVKVGVMQQYQIGTTPRLYSDLAHWWPLLSIPEEYVDEATFFHNVFQEAAEPPRTILELGSGGGCNASHLKAHYHMTLVDRSPGMLAASRTLNPECEHIEGDMRTVRLNRQFDAVFIHDAIMYMTTLEDLGQVMETAWLHCKAGGMVLLVPDYVRETFAPSTLHGGHDGPDRALRYLEWTYDPDETDTTVVVDFVYQLREGADQVQVAYDRHICGIFARADWLRRLEATGFKIQTTMDQYERELFIALKPKVA